MAPLRLRMAPLLRTRLFARGFSTSAGKPDENGSMKTAISAIVDGYHAQMLRNAGNNVIAIGVFLGVGSFVLSWYRGDEEKKTLLLEEWRKVKVSKMEDSTNQVKELNATLEGILEELKVRNKNDQDRAWVFRGCKCV